MFGSPRKVTVAWNNVAPVGIPNYNMAFAVTIARADQSLVHICLPSMEGHALPILIQPSHAQSAAVGDELSRGRLVVAFVRLCLDAHLVVQWTCGDSCASVVGPRQPLCLCGERSFRQAARS